jgi:predicted small lipoprotein YifL
MIERIIILPIFGLSFMTPKFKRLVFLAALCLSGCGQKGPLFIPEQAPTNQQELENEEASSAEEKTAKKDG